MEGGGIMRNKKPLAVCLLLVMLAVLSMLENPVAFATVPKYEKELKIISGSNKDLRTFTYNGHIVSEGFAATVTTFRPVRPNEESFSKAGIAVSLGGPWFEGEGIDSQDYLPFVKEMWIKIEGDSNFRNEVHPNGIATNTGTGAQCTPSWKLVLDILEMVLPYILRKLYEAPPAKEWQSDLHWLKAIVRQDQPPEDFLGQWHPILQTAACDFDIFFQNVLGYQYLTVTAGAAIWLEVYREGREVPQISYYYIGDYSVSFTVEVPVTNEPNDPYPPSGPTSGYVYTTYNYYTSTIDPNGDNVRYEFSWGDGTNNTVTDWYASGSNVSASHFWARPGTYQVQVRAQDVYYEYSNWSPYITVSISQNDADTGGDAGDSFSTATLIGTGSKKGTLYKSNPTDTNDYYKFYVENGQRIYVSMTPPSGVDFDLQLYDPNGSLKGGSYYGDGYTDSISYTADSTGYWRIRIYIYSGEGQYSFYVSVYWPGGGGCPILYVWNGAEYFKEGLLDIHNPEGLDVVCNNTLVAMPQRVHGAYLFRLVEHPQTISHIDQVKLYALLEDKTLVELPLIYAWHSEYGNVLPQLLCSDDWKVDEYGANWNNGASQSIDLKFAALNPNMNIIGFIFQIEGNNMILKV